MPVRGLEPAPGTLFSGNFEAFATAILTSACASFYDVQVICLRTSERARTRLPNTTRQVLHGGVPYEHPPPRRGGRGALGDTVARRRETPRARSRRLSRGWTAPHRTVARSRRPRARAQVAPRGSKIEQAMRTIRANQISAVRARRRPVAQCSSVQKQDRAVHTGHIRRLSRPRSSTSPSAARNLMTTRRRSRRSASRRTTRCARSPSR